MAVGGCVLARRLVRAVTSAGSGLVLPTKTVVCSILSGGSPGVGADEIWRVHELLILIILLLHLGVLEHVSVRWGWLLVLS